VAVAHGEDERSLVRGFILNKFRGDTTLLSPAPRLLSQRTGVPVVGVVPWLDRLDLPEEDAASLVEQATNATQVEIAVVRLPHLANFDEFGPLSLEPGVWVRYVQTPYELRAPDLVIIPGTKATIPDLTWLRERGFVERIRWLVEHGTPVLGICGGFQMLGCTIRDPLHIESDLEYLDGIGLRPGDTELKLDKTLRRVTGVGCGDLSGVWSCLANTTIRGYEIHSGLSTSSARVTALLDLEGRLDGAVSGAVAGTYVHGVFEGAEPRRALVANLAQARGWRAPGSEQPATDPYDRLADALAVNLTLDSLPTLATVSLKSLT
jgi:adenosylcobyric acid synthase